MARIVAWVYASPDWDDTAVDADRFTQTSDFNVVGPGGPMKTRLTVPLPFWTQLAQDCVLTHWATAIAAQYGDTFELTYSPTTRRVSMYAENDDVATTLVKSTPLLTGITSSIGNEAGADAPAAVVELYGVTVEPVVDDPRLELRTYRHGRAAAIAWGNHALHRCTLYISSRDKAVFETGYCLSGRVRITQDDDNAGAYDVTNLGGYLDGYVVSVGDILEDGDIGEMWRCEMLLAVARS